VLELLRDQKQNFVRRNDKMKTEFLRRCISITIYRIQLENIICVKYTFYNTLRFLITRYSQIHKHDMHILYVNYELSFTSLC